MDGAKGSSTPIAAGKPLSINDGNSFLNTSLYRSTVGALQYVTLTNPDISFVVNCLSQFFIAPKQHIGRLVNVCFGT